MWLLSILIITGFLLISIKIIGWYLNYRDCVSKWQQFPGSKSLPILGHLLELKSPKDMLPTFLKHMKQNGLTFRIQLGLNYSLFTADPRLIEIVTSTKFSSTRKSFDILFMKNWLGEGLITSENPRWKLHRRLITPTFHVKVLEDFVPIFNKNAKNLVKFFEENRQNQEFDAYEDILLCSLDAICETAMGISINALKDGKQSNYVSSIKFMGKVLANRAISFWKQYDCLFNLSSERQEEIKMINHVRSITDDVIKTKTEEYARIKDKDVADELGRKKRVAFLDHLLMALDQNGGIMSPESLREEVDTFIFAGHDTVASATSFTIHFLSKHQDVQQRAYEEIQQVYGSENEITFDKLNELKYLECVIKETLRVCPSIPFHARVMTEDVHFDGKIIPKGIDVVLFIYGSHRNEKLYHNPDEFIPDRFLDEDFKKNTNYSYIPFNAGPRNCIGQKYAMTAMKCIVSVLLKEFKFTKNPEFELDLVAEAVLKSSNGIKVKIQKR